MTADCFLHPLLPRGSAPSLHCLYQQPAVPQPATSGPAKHSELCLTNTWFLGGRRRSFGRCHSSHKHLDGDQITQSSEAETIVLNTHQIMNINRERRQLETQRSGTFKSTGTHTHTSRNRKEKKKKSYKRALVQNRPFEPRFRLSGRQDLDQLF